MLREMSAFAIGENKNIYMDNAATTEMPPAVLCAMMPYLCERYGNAGVPYRLGTDSEDAVETARSIIADELGCEASEVFFTSGGTESNNWAIKGMAESGKAIVTSAIEHQSVLASAHATGSDVRLLPNDNTGRVQIAEEMIAGAGLASVQYGNNEIGTLQPIAEIGELCRRHDVPLHCDASQAFGKVELRPRQLGVGLMTISAHKMHGPYGIGALYVNSCLHKRIRTLLHGGGQERGLRSGTLNVPAIVGFAEAVKYCADNRRMRVLRMCRDVEYIASNLVGVYDGVTRNGATLDRLPHILSLSFAGVPGAGIVGYMANRNISMATGSACGTNLRESHVLRAIGLTHEQNAGTVRISLSLDTTSDDIVTLLHVFNQMFANLDSLRY
jgi:cysteine desulfurase